MTCNGMSTEKSSNILNFKTGSNVPVFYGETMPAIIVIVATTAVMYFIFFLEENATQKDRKKKPERRFYPTKLRLTLALFIIIFLPMIATILFLNWNTYIRLDSLTEAELYFAIFRLTISYNAVGFVILAMSIFAYVYAGAERQFWVHLIGIPLQSCTCLFILVLLMLQPHIEIFQSLEVDDVTYHLVYRHDGSGSIHLLACDDKNTICKSDLLGVVDSYMYSDGQMTYHPAYDYLHIRTTGFDVEEYIIPLND